MNIEKPIFKPINPDGQYNIDFNIEPNEDKKEEGVKREEKKEVIDFPNDKEDPGWEYYGRFLDLKKQEGKNQEEKRRNDKKGGKPLFPPFNPYK